MTADDPAAARARLHRRAASIAEAQQRARNLPDTSRRILQQNFRHADAEARRIVEHGRGRASDPPNTRG